MVSWPMPVNIRPQRVASRTHAGPSDGFYCIQAGITGVREDGTNDR